jgi:hypothetical protein
MWIKSSPWIWWGSNRCGHFIFGNTATIFSVKALLVNETKYDGLKYVYINASHLQQVFLLHYFDANMSQNSYIFWPIVEFSWNSKSTSKSMSQDVIHHVIPPTTFKFKMNCSKNYYPMGITYICRSDFWIYLYHSDLQTLSKGERPLIRALKYPAANSKSTVSNSLTFCSSSSRLSTCSSQLQLYVHFGILWYSFVCL